MISSYIWPFYLGCFQVFTWIWRPPCSLHSEWLCSGFCFLSARVEHSCHVLFSFIRRVLTPICKWRRFLPIYRCEWSWLLSHPRISSALIRIISGCHQPLSIDAPPKCLCSVLAYNKVMIKSFNVRVEVIIYPSESAYATNSGSRAVSTTTTPPNKPPSVLKWRCICTLCTKLCVLPVICIVSYCILMRPNRSNREYPLLGVSTRKALITLLAVA